MRDGKVAALVYYGSFHKKQASIVTYESGQPKPIVIKDLGDLGSRD